MSCCAACAVCLCEVYVTWPLLQTVAPVSETINVDFAEGVSDAAELRSKWPVAMHGWLTRVCV